MHCAGTELVVGGDVVYQPVIDVEGNNSVIVTTMLTNSSQQVRVSDVPTTKIQYEALCFARNMAALFFIL